MKEQTMQQAAAHHFGIAWDELGAFEQAHWEAAYRAGRAESEGARLDAELHTQLQRAAEVLPGAWSIELVVEHHAGWIDVFDDDGNKVEFHGEGHFSERVSDAIDMVLELAGEVKP